MPSFSFIVLALAAFTSSVMAVDSDNTTHELTKRRANHADEYGYPHNRGPHVDNGRPMSPGGYRDPHPSNQGSHCKSNRQCHYDAPLALGFCNSKKVCDFTCLGDAVRSDGACVGQFKAPTCRKNKKCPKTKVNHAKSACYDGKCTFVCNDGYKTKGNKCVKINPNEKCGGKTAPVVNGGYASCKGKKWVPVCKAQLGFKAYHINGQYYCINTMTDVNNCGRVGHKCPFGYNGSGTPTCRAGRCHVRGGIQQ